MVIKVLLIASIILLAIFAASGRKRATHRAIRRITVAAVVPIGTVAVLFPGMVNRLANLVGVGRGTDLVLYVFVVAFLFVSVSHYQRMRDIEDMYVTLARRVAVENALRGDPITTPVAAIHEREAEDGGGDDASGGEPRGR